MRPLLSLQAGFYAVFRYLSRSYGPAVLVSALPPVMSSLLALGGWLASGRVELDKYLYQLLGTALLMIAQIALGETAWTVRDWIKEGLLEYLLASPADALALFFGVFLAESLVVSGLSLAFTAAVVGALKGPLYAVSTLAALGLALAGALPLIGLGMALSSLVLLTDDPNVLVMPMGAAMTVVGGALYPLAVLPAYLQYLAAAFPTATWASAARAIALGLEMPAEDLGLLGAYMLYALVGALAFDAVGKLAKGRGIR